MNASDGWAGHAHHVEDRHPEGDGVRDGERRDGGDEAAPPAHEQHHAGDEQQVIDAAQDVLDAEREPVPGPRRARAQRDLGQRARRHSGQPVAVLVLDAHEDVDEAAREARESHHRCAAGLVAEEPLLDDEAVRLTGAAVGAPGPRRSRAAAPRSATPSRPSPESSARTRSRRPPARALPGTRGASRGRARARPATTAPPPSARGPPSSWPHSRAISERLPPSGPSTRGPPLSRLHQVADRGARPAPRLCFHKSGCRSHGCTRSPIEANAATSTS